MAENIFKKYRVTWKHDVYFLAEDDLDARQIWDEMSLGLAEGPRNNSFVEELSFKCIDDDYRDIP